MSMDNFTVDLNKVEDDDKMYLTDEEKRIETLEKMLDCYDDHLMHWKEDLSLYLKNYDKYSKDQIVLKMLDIHNAIERLLSCYD